MESFISDENSPYNKNGLFTELQSVLQMSKTLYRKDFKNKKFFKSFFVEKIFNRTSTQQAKQSADAEVKNSAEAIMKKHTLEEAAIKDLRLSPTTILSIDNKLIERIFRQISH